MTLPSFNLVAAGLLLTVALLWGVITWDAAAALRKREVYPQPFRRLVLLTGLVALHYLFWGLFALIPGHLVGERNLLRGVLMAINDAAVVMLLAVGREVALMWPTGVDPPGRRWQLINYGTATVVAGMVAAVNVAGPAIPHLTAIFAAYLVPMAVLTTRDVARLARSGSWRPGRLIELSGADAVMVVAGLGCIVGLLLVDAITGTTDLPSPHPSPRAVTQLVLNVIGGLLLAVPFVVRDLADVLRGFVATGTTIVGTGALFLGVRTLDRHVDDAEIRHVVDLGAIATVVLLLVPAQAWLRAVIDRLVFHRSRRRWAEAHSLLNSLSPDLGVVECCRRGIAEICRALQLRGAAMLLRDGELIVHGAFPPAPASGWATWTNALPRYTLGQSRFRSLPSPLIALLREADVVAIVPIASPRHRWGHVLITTGLLGATFSDEDDRAVDAVATQFALLLDSAELLARALGVERSLAHAEKLAAIGELAARIAHDIRNPITAARSLAQQLAREPGSAFATEHGLILEELERVERQVAALLRFARREEFRFDRVDLGELVQATLATLRPRLQAAGIALDTDAGPGLVARADGEKLRHVLINVVENAADALGDVDGTRRLAVSLHGTNGTATIEVTDSGPGVSADALPHLFEPFFSLKPNGTGLGLAIAKRTIDAHAGRIGAARAAGGGLTVRVDLPLVRPAAEATP